jgi:hypothetical protein
VWGGRASTALHHRWYPPPLSTVIDTDTAFTHNDRNITICFSHAYPLNILDTWNIDAAIPALAFATLITEILAPADTSAD